MRWTPKLPSQHLRDDTRHDKQGAPVAQGAFPIVSVPRFGPLSAFINKVLLEHNHAHSFIYFLQLLPCYHSRVQSLWQSLPFQIFFFFWKNLLKPLTSLCSCICSALQTEGLAGGETKVDIICDELPGRTFLVQHNPEILSTLSGGVKFSFFFLIVFLILKQKSRSWQTASAIMLIKLWRGPFP